LQHGAAGRLDACIEIDSTGERFAGVLQRGGAKAAAGLLLGGAEFDQAVEAQFARQPDQEGPLGERSAAPAELAFACLGVGPVEGLGNDDLQHGVAEEFEALVAGDARAHGYRRGMAQGIVQKRLVPEFMADSLLEPFDL
jgi:hypothetical protein